MGNLKFNIDDTCVKCGACAEDCPVKCITEGKTRFIIGKGCIGCGDCYSICPVGAVKMYKREVPKSNSQKSFSIVSKLTPIRKAPKEWQLEIRTLKSYL